MPSSFIKIKEILVQGNKGQSKQANIKTVWGKYKKLVIIETGIPDPTRIEKVTALIEAIASHTQANHESGQITRAITDEFSFYPTETPFTLAEYKQIINTTALIAKKLPPDVHLVLATFPVLWPDEGIHNCGLYVQAPKHPDEEPTLHHLSKKNHSETDINYEKLDGTLYPLTKDQDCTDTQRHDFVLNDTSVATHDVNQYLSAIKIISSDGREFISTIGICLDHAMGTERKDVHGLIDQLQAVNVYVPIHCSHVLTSATIEEMNENVLSTMSHADPNPSSRRPSHYPNRSGYTPTCIQSTFSGKLDVEIYPTKPIGTLHSDLFQHIAANKPALQLATELNTPDANGDTLLHQVFAETDFNQELIANRLYSMVLNGGDPNITNKQGKSLKHLEAENNQDSVSQRSNTIISSAINTALAWKKHIDVQNSISPEDLRTPLTRVLIQNKPSVVQFTRINELILSGANPYVKDGYGQNAMDIADSYALYFDRELTKNELKVNFELTKSRHSASALNKKPNLEMCSTTEHPADYKQIDGDNTVDSSIYNADNFHDVLHDLSMPQRIHLFEEMKEQLAKFINSAQSFNNILKYLNPDQRTFVFEKVSDILPELITDSKDLRDILEHITPAQRVFIIDKQKKEWPDFIQNTSGFRDVFKFLSAEQRVFIFEKLNYKWSKFINSEHDFHNVLKYMPLTQASVVTEALKKQLPQSIHSIKNYSAAMLLLSSRQRSLVTELMKEQLPGFIHSSKDFCNIAAFLSTRQLEFVFQEIKTRLPELIDSVQDVSGMLSYLDSAQCEFALSMMADKLPELINSTEDLCAIFDHLNQAQCTFVVKKIYEKLPNLTYFSSNLYNILSKIELQQSLLLFKIISIQLPRIIYSIDDYFKILEIFSPIQHGLVSDAMQEKLPFIIRSLKDFLGILKYLSPDQVKPIYNASLPRLIYSAQNYIELFQQLLPEQHLLVFDAMKKRLSGLIYTHQHFYYIMKHLNSSQRTFVFEQTKARIPKMIRSAEQFNRVLKYLTPEQRTFIFKTMIKELPHFIKSTNDLRSILNYLSKDEQTIIFGIMETLYPTDQGSCSMRNHGVQKQTGPNPADKPIDTDTRAPRLVPY